MAPSGMDDERVVKGIEAFAEVERLIVVAAHPDDVETICGGTLSMLTGQGVTAYVVNCTLGDIGSRAANVDRGELGETRIAEAEEAGRILRVERTYNLGRSDGELVADLKLRAEIARLYRLTQADTLWTFDPFWAGQIHADHREAGQAALDAYMPAKMPLYQPEQLDEPGADLGCLERVFLFATDRDPDVFIEVTDAYETKLAACMAHASQFPEGEENLEWMKELDRDRGQTIDAPYAESFRQMTVW